ncbi:adenine nucleotide alpha hydrolases-like protein [Pleomassaria siparia CBS 279.74]|uniref:Adenine nucleotide alpha hydrolases-like protein n=1 Tax=Pleomassaria siparia CBS 279.74 TaxID=1314801 RepID=A0A6G1KGQ5_9PLEO|nr:adenine nucleotide alpha hydrolases-like protein [Pleomassaria siparia CBS 279.74]
MSGVFQNRVSFDTFDRPAEFIEENSFTLISKHKDYEYTKRSRTFLCGCDDNEYSEYALQWLIDELVDDGDEIVCLRVVEKDDTIANDRNVEKGKYRLEAETLMTHIQNKNNENKAINLVLEFAVGKVNKVIDEMINLYEPAILVVGTRGRSLGGFQGLLPGSVSKYCLQHSPVPVIVVRPSSKRDKARNKRALDPGRHAYKDLLKNTTGGHILDSDNLNSFIAEETTAASDEEAAAVARAIGLRHPVESSHLSQVHIARSPVRSPRSPASAPVSGVPELKIPISVLSGGGTKSVASTPAPVDDLHPGVVMKSPHLQNLDSPEISDISSSSEEEDEGGVITAQPFSTTEAADGSAESKDDAALEPVVKVQPETNDMGTKPEEHKSSGAA